MLRLILKIVRRLIFIEEGMMLTVSVLWRAIARQS
jgi:hypothetical protein